jgi:2-methylcitrate dehydratase PrpD
MIDRLITYALNLSYEEIPDQVIAQAKRCFIDWVGAALGSYGEAVRSILMETIQELGGREQASIIGVPVKTSVYNAALVNGAMSHVLDYDDTHLAALLHPSVTVLPAVLAYGEWKGIDGKDFLLSYVIGVEFVTRISMAMGADHYDAGWHATATMGRFGAAAAISKLAGLKKKQFANALGLAGTQASGIRKVFGTMTKAFHPSYQQVGRSEKKAVCQCPRSGRYPGIWYPEGFRQHDQGVPSGKGGCRRASVRFAGPEGIYEHT